MARHKLEWENNVPFSKIVATQDENGELLIADMGNTQQAVWQLIGAAHGTLYGVNDMEGKEVLLLTGAELCEHYEKLRLAYWLLKSTQGNVEGEERREEDA